jgi:hypothetical protein
MDELLIQQPSNSLSSSGAANVLQHISSDPLSLSPPPYIASVEDERCELWLWMEASKENTRREKRELKPEKC